MPRSTRLVISFAQALAAIAVAGCGAASFFTVPALVLSMTPRDCAIVHFFEGRLRFFWIESSDRPLNVALIGRGPDLRAGSRSAAWPRLPPDKIGVDVPRDGDWDLRIIIGGYRQVSSFGGAWRAPVWSAPLQPPMGFTSFVRLPIWLPCILLLWRPCKVIVHGVRERHRRRNNLCLTCGYHLKGLPEPRCPECGTQTILGELPS